MDKKVFLILILLASFASAVIIIPNSNPNDIPYIWGNITLLFNQNIPYWITQNNVITSNSSINYGNVNITGNLIVNNITGNNGYFNINASYILNPPWLIENIPYWINQSNTITSNITIYGGNVNITGNLTVTGNLTIYGTIIMPNSCGFGWSKGDVKMSNDTIQTTCWKVANGSSGTMDLRSRFIAGAYNMSGGVAKTNMDAYTCPLGSGYNYEACLTQSGGQKTHVHYNSNDFVPVLGIEDLQAAQWSLTSNPKDWATYVDIPEGHVPPYYALVFKECVC